MTDQIRAVLDTNTLVSGFTHSTGASGQILQRWSMGRFELCVSEAILVEFERTLGKPYFSQRLTPEEIAANLVLLNNEATVVPIARELRGVATHPEDDRILETAVTAVAEYLVTGDRQLQLLENFEGIRIVSPREFLDLLVSEDETSQTS